MSGTVLSAAHTLMLLILTTTLRGRYSYDTDVTVGETEAQRG